MDFAISAEMQVPLSTVERLVQEELPPMEAAIDETSVLSPEMAKVIFEKSQARVFTPPTSRKNLTAAG